MTGITFHGITEVTLHKVFDHSTRGHPRYMSFQIHLVDEDGKHHNITVNGVRFRALSITNEEHECEHA